MLIITWWTWSLVAEILVGVVSCLEVMQAVSYGESPLRRSGRLSPSTEDDWCVLHLMGLSRERSILFPDNQ